MGVAEIDVVCREAGDCFVEGDGDGDQSVIAVRDGVGGHGNGGAGRPVDHGGAGGDDEVAAAAGAHPAVAQPVPHAGEVDGDGVVGALDVAAGRVGGCPVLAVGTARRQSAQRAFAGVVLDV